MTSELTREEHIARAMLLGMSYHDGNGHDPFYYKISPDGNINLHEFLDANTLEPLIQNVEEPEFNLDFEGMDKAYKARRKFDGKK